jgi:hypothetical protein
LDTHKEEVGEKTQDNKQEKRRALHLSYPVIKDIRAMHTSILVLLCGCVARTNQTSAVRYIPCATLVHVSSFCMDMLTVDIANNHIDMMAEEFSVCHILGVLKHLDINPITLVIVFFVGFKTLFTKGGTEIDGTPLYIFARVALFAIIKGVLCLYIHSKIASCKVMHIPKVAGQPIHLLFTGHKAKITWKGWGRSID